MVINSFSPEENTGDCDLVVVTTGRDVLLSSCLMGNESSYPSGFHNSSYPDSYFPGAFLIPLKILLGHIHL